MLSSFGFCYRLKHGFDEVRLTSVGSRDQVHKVVLTCVTQVPASPPPVRTGPTSLSSRRSEKPIIFVWSGTVFESADLHVANYVYRRPENGIVTACLALLSRTHCALYDPQFHARQKIMYRIRGFNGTRDICAQSLAIVSPSKAMPPHKSPELIRATSTTIHRCRSMISTRQYKLPVVDRALGFHVAYAPSTLMQRLGERSIGNLFPARERLAQILEQPARLLFLRLRQFAGRRRCDGW